MSRFLNRILGFPVCLQNTLFAYFSDTLEAIVQQAKKMGRWDGGIFGEFKWRPSPSPPSLSLCPCSPPLTPSHLVEVSLSSSLRLWCLQ